MSRLSLIAGSVDVTTLIHELSAARPVFHSEADFQHAVAWQLHRMEPSLHLRLLSDRLPPAWTGKVIG